jgi:hypothetical protein
VTPPEQSTDVTRAYRPGARLARRRASHSYGFVLLLIFTSLVFTAAAPDTDWARSVLVLLQCLTLVAALWTSGLGRDATIGAVVVAGIGVAGAIVTLVTGGEVAIVTGGLLNTALLLATCLVIALGVADQPEANAQAVFGAICVYLSIGMLFTFVYGATAALGSGAFFAQGTDGTPALHLYFSYVTLATIGYGDYTAASNLGHTLSLTEGLLGQLYLVTVVAVLVSRAGKRGS